MISPLLHTHRACLVTWPTWGPWWEAHFHYLQGPGDYKWNKTTSYSASPRGFANGCSACNGLSYMGNWISLGDCSVNKTRMMVYQRQLFFYRSPSLPFFLVNVTVTGTQCCHTPVCGATALTWAAMRWDQVGALCRLCASLSHQTPSRADRSLLSVSTFMFQLQMWFLQN